MSQDGGQSMQGYDHQLSTAQPTDPIMMSDPGSPQLQDPQSYGHPAQHAHLQGFGEEPMGSADIGLIRGYHNPAGTLEDISHAAGRDGALLGVAAHPSGVSNLSHSPSTLASLAGLTTGSPAGQQTSRGSPPGAAKGQGAGQHGGLHQQHQPSAANLHHGRLPGYSSAVPQAYNSMVQPGPQLPANNGSAQSYSQPQQNFQYPQAGYPLPGSSSAFNQQAWDPKILAEVAAHFSTVTSSDPENQTRIKNALAAAIENAAKNQRALASGSLLQSAGMTQFGANTQGYGGANSQRFTSEDLAKSLLNSQYAAPAGTSAPGYPSHPSGGPSAMPFSANSTGELIQQLGDMAAQRYPVQRIHKPTVKKRDYRDDPPLQRVPVICNGNKGQFLVGRQVIVCLCNECTNRAKSSGIGEMELSPTDFERHSGSCTSKKWKYTVKVLETDANGEERPGMNVGVWLERNAPQGSIPRRQILGYSEILGDTAPPASRPIARRAGPRPGRSEPGSRRSMHSRSPGSPGVEGGLDDPEAETEEEEGSESGADRLSRPRPVHPSNRWLKPRPRVDGGTPHELRTGTPYQADIPDMRRHRPEGREGDDPRAGHPGPTTLDALALAASYEKEKADGLHFDATADPQFYPGAPNDPKRALVERGQRTRKKPKWMQGTDEDGQGEETEESDDDDDEDGPRSGRGRKRPFVSDRFKQGKRLRRNLARKARADEPPRIVKWNSLADGFLQLVVQKDGKVFTGALMYQSNMVAEELDEDLEEEVHESSDSEVVEPKPKRRPKGNKRRAHSVESPEFGAEDDALRVKKRNTSGEKPKINEKRRFISSQEYERLAEEGPTPETRCALCHCQADPDQKGAFTTEDARGDVNFDVLQRKSEGMGPMLLVKSSAIMNAWVHVQCALWSPEVYVNTNGDVERASEAIRRGRMLKCKVCNEKGATLGCHKRSCRSSYHLPCARENGCTLEGTVSEDYLVMCREHNPNEGDLVEQMPPMPDAINQERSASRPRGRSNPGAQLSGWDLFPKDTQNLDTLTAAATAMRVGNGIEHAANPLAAHHFGGTVGQSVLRPGRCAVCVIQRKGVCGTQTAPKKCLRRLALEAAGRPIPEAPPGWRTRRPMAHWPAEPARPRQSSGHSRMPAYHPSSSPAPVYTDPSGGAGLGGGLKTEGESRAPDGALAAVTSAVQPENAPQGASHQGTPGMESHTDHQQDATRLQNPDGPADIQQQPSFTTLLNPPESVQDASSTQPSHGADARQDIASGHLSST